MGNTPNIHHAIEQLNATLHPKPASDIKAEPIELTEAMLIPPAATNDAIRQQLIASVEQSVYEQLPQWIAKAVDQALAAQTDNAKQ